MENLKSFLDWLKRQILKLNFQHIVCDKNILEEFFEFLHENPCQAQCVCKKCFFGFNILLSLLLD